MGDSGSNTLIEQRNGTSWAVVPSPGPPAGPLFSTLAGAAAVTALDIWAVGNPRTAAASPPP